MLAKQSSVLLTRGMLADVASIAVALLDQMCMEGCVSHLPPASELQLVQREQWF